MSAVPVSPSKTNNIFNTLKVSPTRSHPPFFPSLTPPSRRKGQLNWKMGQYTKACGQVKSRKDTGSKFGPMEPFMRETGRMAKQTVRESSAMLAGMSTKEIGRMTKPMGMEPIPGVMEASMRDTGKTTYSTDSAPRPGRMETSMRETTSLEARKVKASISGRTGAGMQVTGAKIASQEPGFMSGPMAGGTRETG